MGSPVRLHCVFMLTPSSLVSIKVSFSANIHVNLPKDAYKIAIKLSFTV